MKPSNLCLAPWTHTYLSPQTERRLCCASREQPQNFKQYIDAGEGTGNYNPLTLEEHWNSDHMKSIRVQMMNGEAPKECEVCTNKLLNTDVYRDYFWHLFKHKYDDLIEATAEDGYLSVGPISWDYRFSNLCNFKCRMCGDMLSSSWETEVVKNNMVNYDDPKNNWIKQPMRNQIREFQEETIRKEFYDAVEAKTIEEIYWVGGEPLMYEEMWNSMTRIIELGYANNVYARYNTNLSRTSYKGIDLYTDILVNYRDWQICASLDGTGQIGEYIRTGLDYKQWRKNFENGLTITKNPRQMRIDFTLTLPGLLDLNNIIDLAMEYNVELLAKVVFAFSPDILLSPLAPPHAIIDPLINDGIAYAKSKNSQLLNALIDVLNNLKQRLDFSEQWPDTFKQGAHKGKNHLMKLEQIRDDTYTMDNILSQYTSLHDWWRNV